MNRAVAMRLISLSRRFGLMPGVCARLKLPGLKEGGDISDWVAEKRAAGRSDEAIREGLREALEASNIGLEDFVAYLPEHQFIFMPTWSYVAGGQRQRPTALDRDWCGRQG